MICIQSEPVVPNSNRLRAVILSSTAPSSLTLTGADVDGMGDDDIIAVGSVLRTPEKLYIAYADGVFTETT